VVNDLLAVISRDDLLFTVDLIVLLLQLLLAVLAIIYPTYLLS
jgi:hypothetical protein